MSAFMSSFKSQVNILSLLVFSLLTLGCGDRGASQTASERPNGTVVTEQSSVIALNDPNYALIFAVQNYKDPGIPDLRGPIREAEAIAQVLRDQYGFKTDVYEDPNRQTILDALLSLHTRHFDKNSHLFILFTGHGIFKDEFVTGYFIPQDGIRDDPYYDSYIGFPIIRNSIAATPCNHILLAVDACYSGTIDPAIAFVNFGMKSVPESLDSMTKTKSFSNGKDILKQLKATPVKSRLVITSGFNEETFDPSPFSRAIWQALAEEHTKSYKDGILTYHELLAYLDLIQPAPYIGELPGHEGGRFVFAPKEIKNETPPPRSALLFPRSQEENKIAENQPFSERHDRPAGKSSNELPSRKMPDGNFWTVKNFDLDIPGASFHDEGDSDYIPLYGRLYTWQAAYSACESLGEGWRLPSDRDWQTLAGKCGGCIGCLKVTDSASCYRYLIKEGESGFNATWGGFRDWDGLIKGAGAVGYYWSDTSNQNEVWVYEFKKGQGELARVPYSKDMAFSCRCIKK